MRWALLSLVLMGAALGQTTPGRILVHGHRGARAMRPENTIPAFEYAIAAGVDALELDMAVTKDNVLVVSHDPVLHPPVCSGPAPMAIIHNLTLAEVKQWDCGRVQNPHFPTQQAIPGTRMPTLDEVFRLAPRGKFQFNIETKIFAKATSRADAEAAVRREGLDLASEAGRVAVAAAMAVGPDVAPSPEEFVRLVLAEVRKHHLEKRVILQSFDYRTLRAMKAIAPEIQLSALTEVDRDFVELGRESGAQIISPIYPTVTAAKVAAAHKAGLQVVAWTANRPEDWDKLVAADVDAIISDNPAGLIEHLRKK